MFRKLSKGEKALVSEIDASVKNKWNWRWLEEKIETSLTLSYGKDRKVRKVEICASDCIQKISAPGQAFCFWCQETIRYGSKGKNSPEKPHAGREASPNSKDKAYDAGAGILRNFSKCSLFYLPYLSLLSRCTQVDVLHFRFTGLGIIDSVAALCVYTSWYLSCAMV